MATNPTLLLVPIAENGTKNTLPETQETPGNGLMSQSTGFPAECSLPLGAGGVAPDRADFNGAFNLLSGVAFYAQKGWRFAWDATQDYFEGCIVIDTTDGNAYQALADVSAGGSAPSLDSTNWILYAKQAATEQQPFIPAFNHRDVVATSGTYTAPVSGWYRITVKGGGGGGQGGSSAATSNVGGAGGGEGGTTVAYEYMIAEDLATIVIGAGGAGGATGGHIGTNGGNSTVTVNNNTYTGGGGSAGADGGGLGGDGTIPGAPGGEPMVSASSSLRGYGASGGGSGGGISPSNATPTAAKNGGGGAGGHAYYGSGVQYAGGAGGNGYATFEYFNPSLN